MRGNDMSTLEYARSKRDEILRVAAQHGASNLRIFGSVARSQDRMDSDIDFLVTFEPRRSLLDLAAMSLALKDLLGREVDVASDKGLKPSIRDQVLKEAVPL